jgi:hypothetical protein
MRNGSCSPSYRDFFGLLFSSEPTFNHLLRTGIMYKGCLSLGKFGSFFVCSSRNQSMMPAISESTRRLTMLGKL